MRDMRVRKLTPTECERLQGFPDGWTDVRDATPDTPRWQALGNSMAVPVIRRLMAAMAVSEALCRSPAFWDRAVVRISSTRASPPHMVMRSSASCSV